MKKIVLKTVGTLSMLILAFGLMSNGDGDGGNVVKSKFIGTNTGWGACGPNSSGDGGCSQWEYEQTFIVFIPVSGETPTGGTRPCDCSNSGTAPQ